jgi:hypothetical protein
LRRNRAGLKRIGLLALALVIALGALGVAYSAWTDDLYIDSTVYTGTLDVDISGVSSTFVYKTSTNGIHVDYYYGGTPFNPPPGWMLVASAVTEDTSVWKDPVTQEILDTDSATMTFSGLFPGVDFLTDLELEYLGTVPARISFAEVIPVDLDDPNREDDNYDIFTGLCALGESSSHAEGIWIDAELSTDNGATWTPVADPLGLQLHRNDLVHLTVHVLLPDDPAYDNLSISFTGLITVIQWNLYEEP